MSLRDLKTEALDLQLSIIMYEFGWLKTRKQAKRPREVMDEIDYQEGRRQYANRPYSKPSMIIQK